MYNNTPKNYQCPFCSITKIQEAPHAQFKISHLIYHDKNITAWISSTRWPNNPGIVIIIPNKHYENIYEMPDPLLAKINIFAKQVALAMKKGLKCDGVSMRQHNEPAGNQSVWHYHFQVCPRYKKDNFYINYNKKADATDIERTKYAKIIQKYL